MNHNILQNSIRDLVADSLVETFPEMRLMNDKPYTFAVPVDVNGKTYWARIGVTSCQFADTKAHAAFNPATDSVPAAPALANYRVMRDANIKDNTEARIAKLEAELKRLKEG